MKKILLGTTALVTVGLLAGPALASDPLKVTVGGSVVTGFYVIDADNGASGTKYASSKVALVARNIDVMAEGTLDNGMTAGVDAKLMLSNDWNTGHSPFASFRQLFAYLEGGFGKFEIGGTDGAAYKMHYTSPWFVPGNGVDSPNIYNSALSPTRVSTFSLLATDANKVSYFTPRLAGFQLGLSYTPDTANSVAGSNGPAANGYGIIAENTGVQNVMEAALNYAGTFGSLDVGLDGWYTQGSLAQTGDDPDEYGFGANFGYMGFTLGGAYYKGENVPAPGHWATATGTVGSPTYTAITASGTSTKVWTVGGKYATGPWTVGLAYLDAQGGGTLTGENESWQTGGGYNLGAGVDIGLDLQLNKVQPTSGSATYDAKSAGLVLAVSF